jgi:tRNA dimethylallyltransferase
LAKNALAKVVVVAGPTASGKSLHAYQLAKEHGGVILNGDSLQVYSGLEILTAHPSVESTQSLPHRLYGVVKPSETFSVGQWLELVMAEIQKAHHVGKLPIVVGGTGFYLKALLEGVSPIPPSDPCVRQKLEEREESQHILYQELQTIDPALSARIDPFDRQRTLRGLEVFYGTGRPLSFWQSQKPLPPPYDFEKILLMPSKEELNERIERRLEDMFTQGVLDEVERLSSHTLVEGVAKAIGFRELKAYLEGRCSLREAKDLTLIHTRQYAKRQRTWFRHQWS